jgi:hypothetical protein
MEHAGLVRHRKLGPPTNAWVWELTDWGYQLEPIVLAIGRWAGTSPLRDQDGWFSPDALMLHLKARSDGDSELPPGRYQLRLADHSYAIVVDQTTTSIGRGELENPDATIESDLKTLTAVIKRREPFDRAVQEGSLLVHGDHDAVNHLLTGVQ